MRIGRYDCRPVLIRLAAMATGLACGGAMADPVTVSPATMRQVATTDPRFQSYNVEMAEVIGGNFWKPYDQQSKSTQNARQTANGAPGLQAGRDPTMFEARPPIDLTNARLRKLTRL